MQTSLAKLKKLRGRSFTELRVRGAQEALKLGERLLGGGESSERGFFRAVRPAARNGTGQGTAALILERMRADRETDEARCFFPSLRRQQEVGRLMQSRFAATREALIERAERAATGRFDLLGLTGLDFGDPIDWHLEPVSGRRSPLVHWSRIDYLDPTVAGDKKITWELNRHAHFVTFGQAYVMTGDERYVEAFTRQAWAWMDANPPGVGINWASMLEVSFRAVAWLWALHLMADAPQITAPFLTRVLKFLERHGRHVESYLSHYFSPNTHLTGEALGLVYLGVALPELRRAARWRATGLRILVEQAERQVRRDGVYFENATYYHRYTADFYTHLLLLGRAAGLALPARIEETLVGLFDHLMWIERPDGTTPFMGDDDGGRLLSLGARPANDFRDTLATGAALFGRGDWKHAAGEAAAETLWLLGPEGLERYDAIAAAAPRETARAFADSGYYVMRDGWDAASSYVMVDCGPHGAIGGGHAHADALAFEFAAAGQAWLVDPGTYTYTGDRAARDAFRSTAAHNTIEVDGVPQSTPAGPFAWRDAARSEAFAFADTPDLVYFAGAHDGYRRLADPVTHRRAMLFARAGAVPAYLIVRDHFSAEAAHDYALRYHFDAGCAARVADGGVEAERGEARLHLRAGGGLRARVEEGWVSRAYGERRAAPVAVFEKRGAGPQCFVTLIQPAGEGLTLESGEKEFVIHAGVTTDRIVCDAQRRGDMAVRGALGWARQVRQRVAGFFLADGDCMEIGPFAFCSPTPVEWVAARISEDGGHLGLMMAGARQFNITFNRKIKNISINGRVFAVKPGRHHAAYEKRSNEWEQVG